MNDNELIEYLRKMEAEFLPEPPEGLWRDIERKLPPTARRRAVPMWLRYSGVAASIALLFGVASLFVGSPDKEVAKEEVAKKERADETMDKVEPQTMADRMIATAKPLFSHHGVPSALQIVAEYPNTHVGENDSNQRVDERDTPSEEKTDNAPAIPSSDKNHSDTRPRGKEKRDDSWLARNLKPSRLQSGGNVSLSLYAAGIMASNTSMRNNFTLSSTFPSDATIEGSPYDEIISLNEGMDMDTKKHHRQPVRVGVRVAIPIAGRVAIESGLTYTRLSSTLESGSDENYYTTEQRLNYIGIPLKLRCKLWDGKRVGVYVSGGGMAEKCVSGSAETTFVIAGKYDSEEKQKVSEKSLQLSASLSAGVEANVAKGVSLFVEPGASYCFDNHSSIDNIYKDKPLNFELNVGVRINLNK